MFQRITLEAPDTFLAGREGFGINSFKSKVAFPKMASKDSPRLRLKGLVRCYQCDETNHYAKDCPTKKKKLKELSIDKKIGSSSKKIDRQT